MNQASQTYWKEYCEKVGLDETVTVKAWQFGGLPDHLAQLVVDGMKTATCSGHIFYELEKEALPAVGEYNIILNSLDEPVAITQTTDVSVMPMNEVPEEFAIAEGEGDRTYRFWKEVHIEFFTKALDAVGLEFSEDMKLVCERFKLMDVR